MRLRRPSPALVISIVALVVATAGTASAAVIISNSDQVRRGAINGGDIKNRSLRGGDIARETIRTSNLRDGTVSESKLSKGLQRRMDRVAGSSVGGPGLSAIEAVRRAGPEDQPAGEQPLPVATLTGLPAGTYLISAKTILTPTELTGNLFDALLESQKTAGGHCVLDAAGDVDHSREPIATPGTETPATLTMQLTRTLGSPGDITLLCDATVPWRASDTSIVALELGSSTRRDVEG